MLEATRKVISCLCALLTCSAPLQAQVPSATFSSQAVKVLTHIEKGFPQKEFIPLTKELVTLCGKVSAPTCLQGAREIFSLSARKKYTMGIGAAEQLYSLSRQRIVKDIEGQSGSKDTVALLVTLAEVSNEFGNHKNVVKDYNYFVKEKKSQLATAALNNSAYLGVALSSLVATRNTSQASDLLKIARSNKALSNTQKAEIYVLYGQAVLSAADIVAALGAFTESVTLSPKGKYASVAYYWLSVHAQGGGDMKGAVDFGKKAFNLIPEAKKRAYWEDELIGKLQDLGYSKDAKNAPQKNNDREKRVQSDVKIFEKFKRERGGKK